MSSRDKYATVVVAFLQFVAIGVQAVFLWFAFKAAKDAVNAAETQAKIADRALVASERAWVSVDVRVNSDLTIDSQGNINIGLLFVLRNVGRSPATRVRVNQKPYMSVPNGESVVQAYSAYCSEIRRDDSQQDVLSYVLFP